MNNEGIRGNAPVEVFDLAAWRHMFEVNFFGHIAVSQVLLPQLIRSKGKLINISSVGGRLAIATYGPYGGTKFALEAVSDALRREVAPFGVDVVVIEPGAVQTKISARAIAATNKVASTMTAEQSQRYSGLMSAVTAQAASADKAGWPADKVAKIIAKAIMARRPRTRYGVGREAAMISFLRVLPDRLVDQIPNAVMRPYFPRPD